MKKEEKGHEYYNLAYSTSKVYCRKPEEIVEYFSMWKQAVEDISKVDPQCIVDLGCGAGHFAEMVRRDSSIKIKEYNGFDFSSEAITMAESMIKDPRFKFKLQDIYLLNFDLINKKSPLFVAYEFLEHIEEDLKVISKIKKKSYISFSVPNFDSRGHVRHFKSEEEILNRYSKEIQINKIQKFKKYQADRNDLILYLCFGIKK